MRIVISGTVGVGKSTISNLLVKKLEKSGKAVNFLKEETVNSIYLDYYYKEPKEWAFIAQLDFLMGRFKQWLINEKMLLGQKKQSITIYDRHFLDDYVFAELHVIKKNISIFNSITYQAVYKEIIEKMVTMSAKPDYFILLTANLDSVLKRLESRGRPVEIEANTTYWKELYSNYYERPFFKNHFEKNSKHFILLDTENKTPENITDEIINIIKKNT